MNKYYLVLAFAALAYSPQFEQTLWGKTGAWHLAQTESPIFLRPWLALRLPTFDLECRFFGSGILVVGWL